MVAATWIAAATSLVASLLLSGAAIAAPATQAQSPTAAALPPAPQLGRPRPLPLPRPFLDLQVTLDPGARRVAGTARWTLTNVSDHPLREALFWLYPNRLAERPKALGDVSFHWLYPNGFSPAAMQLGVVRVNTTAAAVRVEASAAGRDTVARVMLPHALAPGAEVGVTLDFTTDLPERLGGFGCARRQCRMMGGFYPFPQHLAGTGFEADAPPDRMDYTTRVVTSPGLDLLVGSTHARSMGTAVSAAATNTAYVTVVTDSGVQIDEAAAGGLRARYFHHDRRRPPSSAAEVLPYVREDRAGLVLDVVTRALEFAAAVGPSQPRPQSQPPALILVEAPLRHELVQVHGDVVLVSDRLFEIFPLNRLRKFHRLELFRAVVAAQANRWLRNNEPDPDVDLATDVLALHLTEVFTVREFHRLERAGDLLRPFAFIPAIDQLLYAPLVASSSSYFGDADERDPIRDDVRRFSQGRAGGWLIYAKLLDLLGPDGLDRLAQAMLRDRIPLRQAAARAFGGALDWFWRQWLGGPPPRVNYRLDRVRSESVGGASTQVTIDVRREGADLWEPVEVRVVDRAGANHDLIWKDRGVAHRFELNLPDGLASVELDPRHRLTETAVGSLDAADDPLTDNRIPRGWRFLYSGAAALVDVTALNLSFAAAVLLKPRHDLRNSVLFLAHHSPSTEIGVKGAYTRLFGQQADRNRLASAFGVGVTAASLNPDFGIGAGETVHPRWRLAGGLFTEHDDRDYLIDPWRAVGMTAEVTVSLTGLDDGRRLPQISTGVELLRLFELFPGHVLAADLQGGATFGDIQVRAQLPQIGGPTGLRGYAAGELFGRGWAMGRLELRDRYVSDLDWNLAHFTAVRGFGGNLFVESGLVTSCDDFGLTKRDVFYDVGYSFRILHDAFGVYQQLLSIDLAVPLNRHDRVCKGQHALGTATEPQAQVHRPPFVVLISFLPSF